MRNLEEIVRQIGCYRPGFRIWTYKIVQKAHADEHLLKSMCMAETSETLLLGI